MLMDILKMAIKDLGAADYQFIGMDHLFSPQGLLVESSGVDDLSAS